MRTNEGCRTELVISSSVTVVCVSNISLVTQVRTGTKYSLDTCMVSNSLGVRGVAVTGSVEDWGLYLASR